MYLYLYDSALKENFYKSKLKAVENRLTDIGITGKIVRLTPFNDAGSIVAEEIKRGAKTVVVVGNDRTLAGVIAAAGDADAVFGFIPMERGVFSSLLGLGTEQAASDIISARKIEKLDLGWMNNRFFLGRIEIGIGRLAIDYDHIFHVSAATGAMGLTVTNLYPWKGKSEADVGRVNPQDGKLEAFVQPVLSKGFLGLKKEKESASIFPFKEMIVSSKEPFQVLADGRESKEVRLHIKLADIKLKMIVGKERKF